MAEDLRARSDPKHGHRNRYHLASGTFADSQLLRKGFSTCKIVIVLPLTIFTPFMTNHFRSHAKRSCMFHGSLVTSTNPHQSQYSIPISRMSLSRCLSHFSSPSLCNHPSESPPGSPIIQNLWHPPTSFPQRSLAFSTTQGMGPTRAFQQACWQAPLPLLQATIASEALAPGIAPSIV